MIEPILWVLWGLWIAQALLSARNLFWFERLRRKQDQRFADVGPDNERPVALIISIKGFDESLTPKFFESVLTQNYANYRAIITMESADEPIVKWLRDQLDLTDEQNTWRPESPPERGIREIVLVFAGEAVDCGQKVHNQIEAFKSLIKEDEIIAFADADIHCEKNWLSKLLAPINKGAYEFSTTYRWLVPKKHSIANFFASIINSSVATLSGHERWNMLWGGSMALSRKAFTELDVPALFAGSLNDDLRLSKAARRRGYKIVLLRSLITPSPINHTWFSFIEFGRRQYYQVKIYTPKLFLSGLFLTSLYTAGVITAYTCVIKGDFYAWIPIGVVTIFDQIRAICRARVIRKLYDGQTAKILDDTAILEHLFTPIWMMVHLFIILLALIARKITWAGITYRAISPSRTRIYSRKELPLPAAMPAAEAVTTAASVGGVAAVAATVGAIALDSDSEKEASPTPEISDDSPQPVKEKATVAETSESTEEPSSPETPPAADGEESKDEAPDSESKDESKDESAENQSESDSKSEDEKETSGELDPSGSDSKEKSDSKEDSDSKEESEPSETASDPDSDSDSSTSDASEKETDSNPDSGKKSEPEPESPTEPEPESPTEPEPESPTEPEPEPEPAPAPIPHSERRRGFPFTDESLLDSIPLITPLTSQKSDESETVTEDEPEPETKTTTSETIEPEKSDSESTNSEQNTLSESDDETVDLSEAPIQSSTSTSPGEKSPIITGPPPLRSAQLARFVNTKNARQLERKLKFDKNLSRAQKSNLSRRAKLSLARSKRTKFKRK